MPKRLVPLIAACLLLGAVPAHADDGVFSFGRLVRATPDAHGRIGVKVNCIAPGGCKLELILRTTGAKPTELGRVYTQILGGTSEVNYVALTKRKVAVLAKKPKTAATFTANVTAGPDPAASYTKPVTLRAPKKKAKR